MSEQLGRQLEDRVLRAVERIRELETGASLLQERSLAAARALREAIAELRADDGERG